MILVIIAAAVSLAFSASAMASTMTKAQYKNARKTIEADYESAKAGCSPLLASVKSLCMAEAKGRQSVALAELAGTYEPSPKAGYKASIARAKADHSVARERCDDKAGSEKRACMKQVDAAFVAAAADARAQLKAQRN